MGNDNNARETYSIDLLQLLKALWHRAWVIVLAAVLAGAIGFSVATFAVAPKYSSAVMLYVNSKSVSIGGSFNISTGDISASRSLVQTYTEILQTRTTLEQIIEHADVDYTSAELKKMITAGSANNTEIMKVTVVSTNPDEAAKIANSIADVLPERIEDIIDGASMEVVDHAVPNRTKISPSVAKYTAIGAILGILLAAGVIVIMTIMDDTINDDDYIRQTYQYPVLARIPDLMESGKRDGYYYQTDKNSAGN